MKGRPSGIAPIAGHWEQRAEELSALRARNEYKIDDCRPQDCEPEPGWAEECDFRMYERNKPADATRVTAPTLRPDFRRGCDITPTKVEWLVEGMIPAANLSLLAGGTGIGKSQLEANLVAAVTRGRSFAGRRCTTEPAHVLIIQAEDDEEAVLTPRLAVADADDTRWVTGTEFLDETANQKLRLTLPLHADALEAMILEEDARLVIIDPIMSFGDFRGHGEPSTHEVRAILDPLALVAKRTGAAIILTMHTRKDSSGSALDSIRGSRAWVECCRSVLWLGVHPADPTRRVLAHAKSNLSPLSGSAEFVMESVGDTSRMVYVCTSHLGADELHQVQRVEERSAVADASEFLLQALAAGPVAGAELIASAEEAGHSAATVKRAKRALGIRGGGKGKRGAAWELPLSSSVTALRKDQAA